MACSPENLLDLAQELLKQETEAAYRGAAHLAYYALFNALLDFAREYLGAELSGNHELHGRLSHYLCQRKNRQQCVFGRALRGAFELRVKADYQLQAVFLQDEAQVQYENCCVQLAALRAMQDRMKQN